MKNIRLKVFSFLFCFLPFFTANAQAPLKIMTYSSLLGEDSFGEFLEKEFPKFCKACKIRLQSTDEMSNLLGKLRQAKKNQASISFDAVLGLDSRDYLSALQEKLIQEGSAFDQSLMAIIVDTKTFPTSEWPKSWQELSSKMKQSVLIPDPRLSSPGFVWLSSIFLYQLQSLENAKLSVARSFPSWSSAYAAFLKGEAKGVWSYLSSEAYHRCREKNDDDKKRYLAVDLAEGYPKQVEYFAERAGGNHPLTKQFSRFLLSDKVQKEIPLKNWMFPINPKIPLPDCFKKLSPIKEASEKLPFNSKAIPTWFDQWAL